MVVEFFAALALVVPAGFREAPALEPAASYVAGKPVQVWCGVTRIGDVYESGYADSGTSGCAASAATCTG
jgi:hypothetical protein